MGEVARTAVPAIPSSRASPSRRIEASHNKHKKTQDQKQSTLDISTSKRHHNHSSVEETKRGTRTTSTPPQYFPHLLETSSFNSATRHIRSRDLPPPCPALPSDIQVGPSWRGNNHTPLTQENHFKDVHGVHLYHTTKSMHQHFFGDLLSFVQ